MFKSIRKQTFRKKARNAFCKAKRSFGKYALMLSALVFLSTGCASNGNENPTNPIPNKPIPIETDSSSSKPRTLDSGLDSSNYEPDVKPFEDKCQSEEIKCSEYSECINNNCITKKENLDLCNQGNTFPIGTFELQNKNGIVSKYEGASLKRGQCISFLSNKHSYTIYRNSDPKSTDLIIFDENMKDHSTSLTADKYLRLGNDVSVLLTSIENQVWILIHSIIQAKDIDVKLLNCDNIADANSRLQFIDNTKKFLVAMEGATGVNLGECFKTVYYKVDPNKDCCAYAYSRGENNFIITSFSLLDSVINYYKKLEWHEPMHALYECVNMLGNDNYHHLFWNAVTDQILREYGDIEEADKSATYVNYWINEINNDPTILDGETKYAGCHGVKTYQLAKEYITLSEQGRKQFIKKFFITLRDDPRLLSYSSGGKAMADTVCGMVNDPNCMDLMKKYCDDI